MKPLRSAIDPETTFNPFAIAGRRLSRATSDAEFEGSIFVGVAVIRPSLDLGTSDRVQFDHPFRFQVLEGGAATPSTLEVHESSPPSQEIVIRTRDAVEPFVVRVATDSAPEGLTVKLAREPELSLQATQQVEGFGLGVASILVEMEGRGDDTEAKVHLHASRGNQPSPPEVSLRTDRFGRSVIRSSGLGVVSLMASAPGFASRSVDIRFVAPWLTLTACGLGGLVGAGVRWSNSRVRSRRSIWRLLVSALASSVIVLALWTLGLNLIPLAIPIAGAQVAIFSVAALGAWFGLGLLLPRSQRGGGTPTDPSSRRQ